MTLETTPPDVEKLIKRLQDLNNDLNRVSDMVEDAIDARNMWRRMAINLYCAMACGCTGHRCTLCRETRAEYERYRDRFNLRYEK